ncbi:hypothetical protein [Bosea lathyri]|uniref:Uncharacterized protein n=1 Tax=Bosea lathyri TaxID=1036778 RepID=A0A1H6CU89_9HYPH|nr:hypothetical protein [Bosea lathyri]SEG76649.1 hypothetical protein SAMN04488115_112135 [Bosea lathyri]
MTDKNPTDVPTTYRTAQRPGQSGEQNQRRAGPSPLSGHPTGPHAPYESDDQDGTAATKHGSQPEPEATAPLPKKGLAGENFTIIDNTGRKG